MQRYRQTWDGLEQHSCCKQNHSRHGMPSSRCMRMRTLSHEHLHWSSNLSFTPASLNCASLPPHFSSCSRASNHRSERIRKICHAGSLHREHAHICNAGNLYRASCRGYRTPPSSSYGTLAASTAWYPDITADARLARVRGQCIPRSKDGGDIQWACARRDARREGPGAARTLAHLFPQCAPRVVRPGSLPDANA